MTLKEKYDILIKLGIIDEEEITFERFPEYFKSPENLFSLILDIRTMNSDETIEKLLFCLLWER